MADAAWGRRRDWERYLSLNLKLALMAMALIVLFKGELVWFAGTLFALFLVFMPAILEADFGVKLPVIFDLAITGSIFLHLAGGYIGLYTALPFYDHITHFVSSATISFIAVTLLYVMTYNMKIIKMPPVGFGLLTMFFAMSMGVLWEFMEWGADLALGTNLQMGLENTMEDLFLDTVAGAIVGTVSMLQLKAGMLPSRETVVEVGDVRNSVGYRRLKGIRGRERKLTRGIIRSFRDPLILDDIVDYIVRESKYISESQRELWKGSGKRE